MREPVQQMLPFDCKECFLKGCDCTCHTCNVARERNNRLSNLELTRLQAMAALERENVSDDLKQRVGRMLNGQGF